MNRASDVDSPPAEDIDDLLNEFPPANTLYHPEAVPSFDGWTSIDLLRQRERDAIDWQRRVSVLTQPGREMDDDEFDAHARAVAAGRLARRVVDGDRDAWGEVLAEELRNEQLPFDFSLDFELETDTSLRLGIQLPTDGVVGFTEPVMQARAEYEDVCCAFLLRIVHEAFRVLPDLAEVVASGYRIAPNPATGRPYREILLHFATDRSNFSSVQWDTVDPSAAFEALGGASRKKRGELRPIATDDDSGAGAWLSRR